VLQSVQHGGEAVRTGVEHCLSLLLGSERRAAADLMENTPTRIVYSLGGLRDDSESFRNFFDRFPQWEQQIAPLLESVNALNALDAGMTAFYWQVPVRTRPGEGTSHIEGPVDDPYAVVTYL
jgi:hypothetical protein